MRVLKFGGTSLADPERVRRVVAIVRDARAADRVVVVVSAFAGVTDALVACAGSAAAGEDGWRASVDALERRHAAAAEDLAAPGEASLLVADAGAILADLREQLHGISMVREASPRSLDRVLSVGERLSAPIVAAALRREGVDAVAYDARELLVTGPEFGAARILEEPTRRRVRRALLEDGRVPVVPGFIAATEDGVTTTLGRGGSDHTASVLGEALAAKAIELWTDVDGVLSADPRIVPEAGLAPEMGYDELMELSHFGAKVVHPPSVHPARRRRIPLVIRNTFRPEGAGTTVRVESPAVAADGPPVRGIASFGPVALLRLEGDGMVGVPGIAMRLFGALARRRVSVILITQASSEHSICFAVSPEAAESAARAVDEEFLAERRAELIDELVREENLAIVAVVGAGMREQVGVAGRIFGALGRAGVNVRAVAQGSSELNVSLVVHRDDETRAVRAVHDAFFRPPVRDVDVVLAGVGGVGRALLAQWADRREALERESGIRLRLVAAASSRGARVDAAGLDPRDAATAARTSPDLVPLADAVAALLRSPAPCRVFVDCTASADVAGRYAALLDRGVAVVAANKLAFAGPLADFRRLRTPARRALLRHETTVGAALPVIGPLEDLVATGDRVRRIEGVLSGTLGLMTTALGDGKPFSEALLAAWEAGNTEPDPREDLGGRDVARKILILARIAGVALEPDDVDVEPFLPDEPWSSLSIEEFRRRLPEADETLAARARAAAATGKRLVYRAELESGRARVGFAEIGADHPGATIRGTENLVAFTTDRFAAAPLIVRGPGAGPVMTASGVLADLLRLAAGPGGSA